MTIDSGRISPHVAKLVVDPTLPVALVGVLAAVGITLVNVDFAAVLPFALVFLATACLTWKRLSPVALSPAIYFAGYLGLVAVLGVLLTNSLVGAGGTGGVDVALDVRVAAQTANAMLSAASITLVAAAIARGRPRGVSLSTVFDLGEISRYAGWFLFFGTIELVSLVYILGYDELLERTSRLVGRGSSVEAVVQMAAIAAVVVVGIAFFARRGVLRVYAFVLLAGFVGYFVSMGTRRLALVPVLILLAYAISNRGKVPVLALLFTAATALITLALPLYFRGQVTHGLIPYIASLSSFTLSPEVVATSFNNFLAGFKISAMTGFQQSPIPPEILWISITPIGGETAGWYEVSQSLRLNRFTPYSAIGELINYGAGTFVLMISVIGLALGLIQRTNDQLLSDPLGRFVAIISLGLIFIFVIQSAQYNLRSDLRYLYLALGAQLIGMLIFRTRDSLARRRAGR